MARLAPGPRNTFPGSLLLRLRRDPLQAMAAISAQYGDVARFKMGTETMFLINHPDLIKDVLVTQSRLFQKGRGLEKVKKFLGEGLLTSEGALHLRQRRMMQPAFHQQRIAAFAEMMTAQTERRMEHWRSETDLDVADEMMRLTLAIVAETLFGADLENDADTVGASLTTMIHSFPFMMLPFSDFLEKFPFPVVRRMNAAHARLDEIIYRLIQQRRQSSAEHHDLLEMLLASQDEENGDTRMSDEQVRDEAMTIFLAGHETTANALNWTWVLLAQHPEVEAKLLDEICQALSGKIPTLSDLPNLPYAEKVIRESFRLYPPAWMLGRRATQATEIGGYSPAGALDRDHEPVCLATGRAFFSRSGKISPGTLDARVPGCAAETRLFSLWRRTAPVHWRGFCLDGSDSLDGHHPATLGTAARLDHAAGARAAGHFAPERRPADAPFAPKFRLHRLNQTVWKTSHSVSHDLRASLRQITGFASLLGKQSSPLFLEEVRYFYKTS